MFLSNYHSHCSFCDGRSTMEDFVQFAIAKGIRKYGFSSHAPMPFLTSWTMLADDFDDYEKEFYRLKTKYSGQIELYLGLEIDFIKDCTDSGNDFFADKKLDYSIGSIHYLDRIEGNKYWTIDGPFDEFDQGLQLLYGGDIQAATLAFFRETARMIQKAGFDIVGHIDKIIYHGRNYSDFDIESTWYKDAFTHILEMVKADGFILEINTKSLADHGFSYPHKNFYGLIKELDIPIMVNSDCHYPHLITAGFEKTYHELYQIGFRSLQQMTDQGWKAMAFNKHGLLE